MKRGAPLADPMPGAPGTRNTFQLPGWNGDGNLNSTEMTRVGLKLLLFVGIISAWQRSVAANLPNANTEATSQNSSILVTNVAQLRALSRADFNRGRPVSLTGTVTLVDQDRKRLVLQDATGAVMWYSDKPVDAGLADKMIRITCSNACTYATAFPDFPYKPSGSDIQESFEAPSNWGDYHLTRMAAHLHPPRSGTYTFWIASDDSSELWLSSDENPAHVRRIAWVAEGFWTSPEEWDRFPSQRSESIYLSADKSYYIEAFQEQGLQADHLAVAWEGPEIDRAVIPGENLTPWATRAGLTNAAWSGPTNGVLREYWTNYSVGNVTLVTPGGAADTTLAGEGATFEVLGPGTRPQPRAVDLSEPILPEYNFCWIQTEGVVTFVSTDGTGATLELAAGQRRALIRVAKWNQNQLQAGQRWHVQVQGVCESSTDINGDLNVGFIRVPTSEDVRLLETVKDRNESIVPTDSTTAAAPSSGGYYSARGAVMFDGWFSGKRYLYVQDINGSVCVSDADRVLKAPLEAGQRVQVGGTVSPGRAGFQLVPMTLRRLGWQSLPLPTDIGDASTYRDGQWTEVEGVVHSVRADGVLKVKGPKGFVSVWSPETPADDSLVDCVVRIRGVLSMESQDAPLLLVGSRQFVEIEEQGTKDPFTLAGSEISSLDHLPNGNAPLHRVKVAGTVSYANGSTVFLQDKSGAVRIDPGRAPVLHVGERFEVVGFPNVSGSIRVLTEPIFHAIQSAGPLIPSALDLTDAFAKGKNGKLVQVTGNLLAQKSRGPVQVLELQSDERSFEAVLMADNGQLPPLAPGSLLKVTGVCVGDLVAAPNAKAADWEDTAIASLQILLRAPADILVERGPPWWTPMKAASMISFLLAVLGGTFLWVHLLRRRYERRQLAQLEFSRQILKSQEAERHRIAANLHDSLGQNLLVIKNQVRLAMQPAQDKNTVVERLDQISGMASQAIEEVRQIAHDLRPYQLERVGLTQTLRSTIRQVSENCPIAFASHVDDIDGLFDYDADIHIYRILQEALNNVIKHSGATEATVVVRKEGASVVIVVRDNGRGFGNDGANGTERSRAGFGLSGIDERARILRGKALFESRAGEGFRLTIEIPLTRKA